MRTIAPEAQQSRDVEFSIRVTAIIPTGLRALFSEASRFSGEAREINTKALRLQNRRWKGATSSAHLLTDGTRRGVEKHKSISREHPLPSRTAHDQWEVHVVRTSEALTHAHIVQRQI